MKRSKIIPILIIAAIAGLVLWGISLFRQTFIPWYILLLPILLSPVITFPVIRPLMKKMKEDNIGSWLMSVVYGAPLGYFLFLWVNFHIPQSNRLYIQAFKIVKKGTAYSRSKPNTPFINIFFENRKKQLFFSMDEKALIDMADSIEIEYRQGLLGFKTIRNYRFR